MTPFIFGLKSTSNTVVSHFSEQFKFVSVDCSEQVACSSNKILKNSKELLE